SNDAPQLFTNSPSLCPVSGALLNAQRLRVAVPNPRQVVGRGGQGDLHPYFHQAPTSELPHSPLFFQHSKDRFNQTLTPRVDRSSGRTPQLPSHRSVGCIARPTPQAPSAVHHPRQVRIRHISV